MQRISLGDFEIDFANIMARVEAGESVILTRDGKDILMLKPSDVISNGG